MNLYGFAVGDPVNYADPFGLCEPMPGCLYGWESLEESLREAGDGAKQFANEIAEDVRTAANMVHFGVSGTAGQYAPKVEASGDEGVKFGHSLEVAGPPLGGSIDVGVKRHLPEGAVTGSANVHPPILGKHLGLSIEMCRPKGQLMPLPYGATLHIGAGIGIETL